MLIFADCFTSVRLDARVKMAVPCFSEMFFFSSFSLADNPWTSGMRRRAFLLTLALLVPMLGWARDTTKLLPPLEVEGERPH